MRQSDSVSDHMSDFCFSCRASLKNGARFCGKCGATQQQAFASGVDVNVLAVALASFEGANNIHPIELNAPQIPINPCGQCGGPLKAAAKFCGKCGAANCVAPPSKLDSFVVEKRPVVADKGAIEWALEKDDFCKVESDDSIPPGALEVKCSEVGQHTTNVTQGCSVCGNSVGAENALCECCANRFGDGHSEGYGSVQTAAPPRPPTAYRTLAETSEVQDESKSPLKSPRISAWLPKAGASIVIFGALVGAGVYWHMGTKQSVGKDERAVGDNSQIDKNSSKNSKDNQQELALEGRGIDQTSTSAVGKATSVSQSPEVSDIKHVDDAEKQRHEYTKRIEKNRQVKRSLGPETSRKRDQAAVVGSKQAASSPPLPSKKTDDTYNDRVAAECRKGVAGLICREKVRWSLCEGKWTDVKVPGNTICYVGAQGSN